MLDNQQLRTYYDSFMEYMNLAEPLTWLSIQRQTITKPDFVAAMRRWAGDITNNTK